MTTPQNELYRLSSSIRELKELFQTPEGELSLFKKVDYIYRTHDITFKRLDYLSHQMSIIIKLLSKGKYESGNDNDSGD